MRKAQVSDSRVIVALLSPFLIMILKGFILRLFNPLPNNRIFNETKLIAFEMTVILNVAKITMSFYVRVENTIGKRENAACQGFPKSCSLVLLKVGFV